MWLFDLETTRFLAVNAAAIAKYGYSEEEFLTMSILDIRPPAEQARLRVLLHQRAFGLDANRGAWRHKKKNGEIIDVDIAAETISLDGRPARLISVNDVTVQLRTERQIAQQAALIDQANDAIIVRDLEYVVLFWNKGAERLYGWAAAEAIGRKEEEVLNVRPEKFAEAMRRILETGDWSGELAQTTKDQRNIIVSARWSLLRHDDGTPRAVLAIKSDITERRKFEEQALRAQRLESIGMIAAGITHDLNNVLAPIGMAASLLRDRLSSTGDLRLIDTLEKCADRGAGLVRQILGFVHGIGTEPSVVQAKHLLRDITEIITETFPKSIVLNEEVPNDLWPVLANPTQIHQVLLNLCVNARDAMPNGGTLTVRAENCVLEANAAAAIEGATAGAWLVLHIEDTGTGIPPAVVARMWEPFFSTKPPSKGTGLGLSTVRGIVQTCHGFITLQTGLNRGTCVRVFLPAAQSAIAGDGSAHALSSKRGRGELILLVDDEEFIRNLAGATLTRAGYRVVTAADGSEATWAFESNAAEIALVITDLDMPNVNGEALAGLIRAFKPQLRILAMSGDGSRQTKANPTEFASAFMSKPFTAETLLTQVHQLLLDVAALSRTRLH